MFDRFLTLHIKRLNGLKVLFIKKMFLTNISEALTL